MNQLTEDVQFRNKIEETSSSLTKIKNLVWNNGLNNLGKFLFARMLYFYERTRERYKSRL